MLNVPRTTAPRQLVLDTVGAVASLHMSNEEQAVAQFELDISEGWPYNYEEAA
jgi:hypothetical protein